MLINAVHLARRAGLAIVLGGALATGACASISSYSGYQSIDSRPSDLVIGTDTKSTARAKLGSPSITSTFDPNTWFYLSQIKARVAFRRPQVTKRDVVALSFDKDTEVLKSVDVLTLKDGKVIAFNDRETPTRGREMTILEQLLGSVGRGGLLPQQDQGVPGSRPGDRRR